MGETEKGTYTTDENNGFNALPEDRDERQEEQGPTRVATGAVKLCLVAPLPFMKEGQGETMEGGRGAADPRKKWM